MAPTIHLIVFCLFIFFILSSSSSCTKYSQRSGSLKELDEKSSRELVVNRILDQDNILAAPQDENFSWKKAISRRVTKRQLTKTSELKVAQNSTKNTKKTELHVQVTAIHVAKSEFPLSKLLFKLTLRLALSEALERLSGGGGGGDGNDETKQQHERSSRTNGSVKLSLSVRSANTCSRQYAAAVAAEEFYLRRSRLFIVSGCDDAIRAVSRLASQWRVPTLTGAGFSSDLQDKSVHKTLIRVAFSLRAAVEFLFKLLKSFGWRRVNLIIDQSDTNSLALAGSIEQFAGKQQQQLLFSSNLNDSDFQVTLNKRSFDLVSLMAGGVDLTSGNKTEQNDDDDDKWPNEITRQVIEDTLNQCAEYSRVSIVLMPQQLIRRFMLSAYDQQMATGMYTFINIPLLLATSNGVQQQQQDTSIPMAAQAAAASQQQQQQTLATGENAFIWRSLSSSRVRNAQAKQAFESLMSIYLRTPTTKAYVYFASKLNNLANNLQLKKHNYHSMTKAKAMAMGNNSQIVAPSSGTKVTSNENKKLQLDINPYSTSFYDSLQIYAWALNESLRNNKANYNYTINYDNDANIHSQISELVRSKRFDNMATGNLYINSNGDRETDYTLDDMNQMTGKFTPVILFRGETRDIERLGRIHWSSNPSIGPTSDQVDCSLINTCTGKPLSRFTFSLILLAGPMVIILIGLSLLIHNRLSLESQLVDHWWRIHLNELELVQTRRKRAANSSLILSGTGAGTGTGANSSVITSHDMPEVVNKCRLMISTSGRLSAANSVISCGRADRTEITRATDTSVEWGVSAADVCYGNITLAIHKLAKVALKPISKFHQSRKLMIELRTLKDVNHANLCRFVGILVDEGHLALVIEFCAKGSLREFLHNESMVIDWTFKYSIINDILAGLQYLHSNSALQFHGRLKSSNCLVSSRFVVKLSDYGPHSLFDQLDDEAAAAAAAVTGDGDGDGDSQLDEWLKGRLWIAPELLKPSGNCSGSGSMRADVYSLGLLLYEIITNSMPFFDVQRNDYLKPVKILHQEIRSHGPRELMAPLVSAIELKYKEQEQQQQQGDNKITLSKDIGPLVELMKNCWHFEPNKRPSSQSVSVSLKRITRGVTSKKLLENLTSRMEQYTNNLESLVEAKLATLMEEKLKSDELLYQFVPQSIASLLKEGQFVEPEAFECVTVFYSDIVGFTSLSSESSPMEVVDFLSDLYQCFDQILEQHDIFKVDTIGDAYIVASGLPQRNDDKHVIEIACAALELRDNLKRFKIPHKPEHSLEMRVGIHSGPCIAGIVGGLNMPKYCVFGDTLTTGKFMESSGMPMKIHITQESRQLLQSAAQPGNFNIEPRTPRITREGLPFQTYWLEKAL